MTDLLRFDRVTCVRGGRTLFEDLDLTLGSGDALQVTGPNGCGKSSLLRLASGLLAPATGRVERSGPPALADDGLALDRERTLGTALGWWVGSDRVAEALDAFGLTPLTFVPVRLLSTGQARRARLARVAASGATLWLLDEPLTGLDPGGMALLETAIAAHRSAGGAVLAASHVAFGGPWRELALA